jgi:hypothetical protein
MPNVITIMMFAATGPTSSINAYSVLSESKSYELGEFHMLETFMIHASGTRMYICTNTKCSFASKSKLRTVQRMTNEREGEAIAEKKRANKKYHAEMVTSVQDVWRMEKKKSSLIDEQLA